MEAQRPWRLSEATQPLDRFAPVLAVTLFRQAPWGHEILTGVRTVAANRTHPEVVSVPTLRIPSVIAQRWLGQVATHPETLGPDVLREVENLLARKLGIADFLELGHVELSLLKIGAWQGTSIIGETEEGLVCEDLTMFNACVEVCSGAELIPERTASYAPIGWAKVDRFLRMVQARDVGALELGFDELRYCAYGLCLETALRMLQCCDLQTATCGSSRVLARASHG